MVETVTDDKSFGVSVGRTSAWLEGPTTSLAILETSDGLTHHIRIIDNTKKWLRYVLRHDQREYLIAVSTVKLFTEGPVTCLICADLGPERRANDTSVEDVVGGC